MIYRILILALVGISFTVSAKTTVDGFALHYRDSGPRVVVNPNLKLTAKQTTGDDNRLRPMAKMRTQAGIDFEFVENEVYLLAQDRATLDDFLRRWQGELISTAYADTHKAVDQPMLYVIRVNPELADLNRLNERLSQIDKGIKGKVAVSSRRAQQLLALLAEETVSHGLKIGLNLGFYVTQNNRITVLGLKQLIAKPR